MNPYGYGSLSIYLLILSILHFIQCILVIIMDLDKPWDTGLLAINNLICPLFHCIWTGNRLAIVFITITLGIETLVLLQRETNFPSNTILRWIIADGNHRKSIRISISVILLAGIYGLIEIAYWRIQYYNVEYEITHSANQLSLSSSSSSLSSSSLSSITSLKSLEPLTRCEVAGGLQYWFIMKSMHRYDIFTEIDITRKTTELAASYFDYQWITGMIIDCSFALINICIGLAIIRAYFMDDLIIRPRYAESFATITRRNQFEVLHIAIICIIQGLCRLPNALFTMLDPLTRPGDMNLTDSEVLKDNTWQRFFLMLSAKVIGIELGDFIAALLMPICIGFCQEFRQNFYGLLKFNTSKLLKTTLLSLNPRKSMSRIITPSNSNIPNDSIQNIHGKMIKKPPSHQHHPHHHHHHHQQQQQQQQQQEQQQQHDHTEYNSKQYHDTSSHLINQLESHNKNINDQSEDSTTERYIPNCHFHKLLTEGDNTEIQNETDLETTYDNTNHYHHDHDHDHNYDDDHHLHQHDLNSLKQYPTHLHSNKQNSFYIKPINYEYHNRSNLNLHDSMPNSLFCSYNKLSTQYCNHSKPNSLTNLYYDGIDCDQVHMDKVKPLLEYRSYV
ncbi:unnamed protein product [Schistosoma spindalis]|nr:unnamed protein product [Schistosoma spindale]